ncbi:hypothetical protein QQF73_08780 [Marinobacter sp. M216]|uniref:Uncharacterized protein n=1 Tax=Marinobacter albus TaxID=3030833 RepID=A0ABT7HBH7_9GAMM|nr:MULTISPECIES: hypothetical protein [unclassified Marinobacter]MBW7470022.1 hypothetical protein [Marinobacter sp. F4218]MDK9557715.1 hypothetical protein [Marinobacter sp. M216]
MGKPNSALLALVGMLAFAWNSGIAASEASGDSSRDGNPLTVEGISASVGEDNPRVLYILPWQAPSLPRRPRQELEDKAPELVQPVNPITLEQHRVFRQTLNPLVLSPGRDSTVTTQ